MSKINVRKNTSTTAIKLDSEEQVFGKKDEQFFFRYAIPFLRQNNLLDEKSDKETPASTYKPIYQSMRMKAQENIYKRRKSK